MMLIGSRQNVCRRWALRLAAPAAAIALAPAAGAAFTPTLTAATTASGIATIDFQQPRDDDAPALLAIHAPTGSLKLGTAIGTRLGSATSAAVAPDIGGSVVRLTGNVAVASASTPLTGGAASTAGAATTACVGSAPDEIWVATLRGVRADGAAADRGAADRVGAAAGGYVLSVCPPPGNVPSGTPGRAVLGMKLIRLKLIVGHVVTPTRREARLAPASAPRTPRTRRRRTRPQASRPRRATPRPSS